MQDKISFEDRLKNVEDIAEKLESGKLGLEEMLQAYQNGMNALEVLEKELSEARQKLSQIRQKSDGTLEEVPLEDSGNAQGLS
jgi:exodeoxyribonuclease VII small subunit